MIYHDHYWYPQKCYYSRFINVKICKAPFLLHFKWTVEVDLFLLLYIFEVSET